MMRIKETQQLPLSVAFRDRRGGSAQRPDGVTITWESSDEGVATVQGGSDDSMAMVTPRGPGSCQITAKTEDGNAVGNFDLVVDADSDIDLVITAGRAMPMSQQGRARRGEQTEPDDRPLEERVAERSTARGAERGEVASETHQNRPGRRGRRA